MTSVALISRMPGILMPKALAVLLLITSSNFARCSIEMSPGLTPCRIWYICPAVRMTG